MLRGSRWCLMQYIPSAWKRQAFLKVGAPQQQAPPPIGGGVAVGAGGGGHDRRRRQQLAAPWTELQPPLQGIVTGCRLCALR
jgi:hypothetical protein